MRILGTVCALGLLAACGGSPTGPDPVPSPPVVTVSAPEPPPVVPAEPAPVPVPVPAPVPTMPKTWTATTTASHWYGPALVPDYFAVEWRYDTLWFGPVTASIQIQDGSSVLARTQTVTVQLVLDGDVGSWTINGLAGQASGTLRLE